MKSSAAYKKVRYAYNRQKDINRDSWPLLTGFFGKSDDGKLVLYDNYGFPLRPEDALFVKTMVDSYLSDWDPDELNETIDELNEKERIKLSVQYNMHGRPKKDQTDGYVYVLRRQQDRYRKVGYSRDPIMRATSIVGAFVDQSFRVNNMVQAEAYLHAAFDEKHVAGEWYDLTDEDVATIPALLQKADTLGDLT